MSTFIVIYRGPTIASARMIALSVDPVLVADVSARMLQERAQEVSDPIVNSVEQGRTVALQRIWEEATYEQP